MARTVQDAINRCREILQDEAGDRYTQDQMISHLVDAVQIARSTRPDLFVAAFGTSFPDTYALGDPFPLPAQFFATACYYICGACELRDDEFAADNRAMTLQAALTSKLLKGA
jgi:hypothetical protein